MTDFGGAPQGGGGVPQGGGGMRQGGGQGGGGVPQGGGGVRQGDVPIEPSPTNLPTPIGPQGPARSPDAQQPRPLSLRSSIQEAFRKSRDPEWIKSRPGPAQATRGHNQPPELLAEERGTPREQERERELPPFDLKKRPVEEPRRRRNQRNQAERDRGEGGRFVPRAQQAGQPQVSGQQSQQPQRPTPYNPANNPLPPQAPHREPPPRMTDQAKSQWHVAPEPVRGEFVRMHREFAHAHQRYQQFKADSEAFAPVRAYHDLARQHGTTLDRALHNYVSIENKLRSDPIAGLDLIVNNMNLRTQDGRRIGLRDISWHVLNQTPEQISLMQANNAQAAQAAQLAQIRQQQALLAQQQQRMQYEHLYRQTRSGVDRFAETHPRLDELGPIIEREYRLGFDLETAYQRACMLVPLTRAANGNPNSQQRLPDRSIHGAPNGGQLNGTRRKSTGVRSSIANAIAQVRGTL